MAGALEANVDLEANFANGSYPMKTTEQIERSLSPRWPSNPPSQDWVAYLSPGFFYMRKKHLSYLNYCYFAFFCYHLPNLILIVLMIQTITRLSKFSSLASLQRFVNDISWCYKCWKPYKNIKILNRSKQPCLSCIRPKHPSGLPYWWQLLGLLTNS